MSDTLPLYESSARFHHTESPNSTWTYGQKVEATQVGKDWIAGERKGWKTVNTEEEDPAKLSRLMTSGIIPRPIAFVSSISESGIENLAPFSWFNMVTHSPPVISISCRHTANGLKDTTINIKSTRGFTVNIISEPWVENANACCIDAPPETSEWPISGLTREPSIHVKAPRVKESAFSMECELFQAIDIVDPLTKQATTTLVLGHVKYVHVRNDVLTEKGTVDPALLRPVARMGDITYSRLGDGFRLARPVWKAEAEDIQKALENNK